MNDDLDYVYIAPDLVWRGAGPVRIEVRSIQDAPISHGHAEAINSQRAQPPAKPARARKSNVEIVKSLSRRVAVRHG